MPHEGSVCLNGQLPFDLRHVDGLNDADRDLAERHHRHQTKQRRQPLRILPGQDPVQKYPGKYRIEDPRGRRDQAGEHHKKKRRSCPPQPLLHKSQDAAAAPAVFKDLFRREHPTDSRKGAVKFLPGDRHPSPGRVVEQRALFGKAAQHHKMIEIPVDDAGKAPLLPQGFRLVPKALCRHMIASRRPQHVFCAGSVPGYAAVAAHLLQRHPFSVIGQDHGETGRPAFQRLHLHDHRHLSAAPDPCFHTLYTRAFPSCPVSVPSGFLFCLLSVLTDFCPDRFSARPVSVSAAPVPVMSRFPDSGERRPDGSNRSRWRPCIPAPLPGPRPF